MRIFDIQKCSYHDGPGLRTVIYTKGCTLRCAWCHNPESLNACPELFWDSRLCIHCGMCGQACPYSCIQAVGSSWSYSPVNCILCGECAKCCASGALRLIGCDMTQEDLMTVIRKDVEFYKISGGGVTFSGGEPLLWSNELLPILQQCRAENISTAIDTAGNVDFSYIEPLLPFVDFWLYDVKIMDTDLHNTWCGADNQLILTNLNHLSDCGASIYIRTPIIPAINDTTQNLCEMLSYLNTLSGIKRVELLPYHTLGRSKYASLGREYPLADTDAISKETMDQLNAVLSRELKLKS